VFGFFPWESLRIFVESYGLTSIFSDGKGRFLVRTNPTAIRHGIETAGFSPTCVVSLSNSCWVWGQAPPCCSVDTRSNDTGETLRAQKTPRNAIIIPSVALCAHSLPLYSAPSPRLGVLRDHDYSNTLRCENSQERKQTFLTLTIQHSLVCVRNPIPLRATGAWLTRDTHTHNTIHRVIN
jgi:hypothetical protein